MRRPRRGAPAGWGLLLAVALLLASAPVARADEADDLRGALLGGTRSSWPQVLSKVERSPALVGEVVGPLLKDRSVVLPSAFAAAWLADRAAKGSVALLADEALARARDDARWVTALQESLSPDGGGWAAFVLAARRRLVDGTAALAVREAAAWALRYEPTKSNAVDLVDAWETGPESVRAVAGDSVRFLLAYPFPSPAAAKQWFSAHDREPFAFWVRDLSVAKDAPDWPLYARLVVEAKANVERLSSAKDLARYLSPSETPWVEVRRLAAQRAARMTEPGEEWLAVLAAALDREPDRETMLSLLEVARRVRPASGPGAASLAASVIARLPECCGEREVVLRLLAVLGAVGDSAAVQKAFDHLEGTAREDVLDALIDVAGDVGGAEAALKRFHAARSASKDEVSLRLRASALAALSRGAPRSTPEGAAAAARYLRAVLRPTDAPDEDGAAPRETARTARLAAVKGLETFPSAETAARLADLATGDADPAVALAAIDALGRLAPHSEDATYALVAVARDDGAVEPRVRALSALSRAALDSGPAVRADAGPAVLSLLSSPDAPPAVKAAALDASAAFGASDALASAFAFAASRTKGGVAAVPADVVASLDRLVRAAAQSDAGLDRAIGEGLSRLADAGGLDAAVEVADAAADAGGGRLALQVFRSDLLLRRAGADGASDERRRDDVLAARRILRSVVTSDVSPDDRSGEAWRLALSSYEAVLSSLLVAAGDDAGARKPLLFEAVRMAAVAGDEAAVSLGRQRAAALLALDLTPAERDEAVGLSKRLGAAPSPPSPR